MYERFYEGVGESWQTNALMKNAQLEGGAGLGFGVQVQCNDKVVVTIGGGAGTGFAGVYGNMTAGGGGGAGLQGRAIHAYMFDHTYGAGALLPKVAVCLCMRSSRGDLGCPAAYDTSGTQLFEAGGGECPRGHGARVWLSVGGVGVCLGCASHH